MTEVYMECDDVLAMLRRHRHDWLLSDPDLRTFHRLRADWAGGKGFWSRARSHPADEAVRVLALEGNRMERARQEARQRREDMAELQFDSIQLTGWTGRPIGQIPPGWTGTPVDAWRLESVDLWWRGLVLGLSQAALDWLEPFVDRTRITPHRSSWNHLWYHEAATDELPREWMRWAVSFLQGVRKVTPGTPGDNQLSVYCYDVDGLISCDRTFVDIINRVAAEAPRPVAQAYRLQNSADPVDVVIRSGLELK